MGIQVGDSVVPGDILKEIQFVKGVTVIGPGLKRNDTLPNTLQITRCGILKFRSPNTYWIDGNQKRYVPRRGDLVIGTILKKSGDILRVDIGSGEPASLSLLAFEGATKKLKPDVQVGDVVYAKVLNAHREMEPELVCVDSYFKAGKLGVLSNDGFVVSISLNLVNRLLNVENPLLSTLGKKFPYEIAIGMNGKVWINAKSVKNILTVVRVLETAETTDDVTILDICRQNK